MAARPGSRWTSGRREMCSGWRSGWTPTDSATADTIDPSTVEDDVAVQRPATDGRIVRRPGILGGEPIVRGTRISVRSVVLASREYGAPEGVLEAYPQLTTVDVDDALAYYGAHKAEI